MDPESFAQDHLNLDPADPFRASVLCMGNFEVVHAWTRIVLAAVLALTVAPEQTGPAPLWAPPLGHPLRISESYSLPDGPYRAGHRGIDLFAKPGDLVRMPAAGTVTFVGTVVDRPVISIRIDKNTVVSFEPVRSKASEGDLIAQGAVIGEVASYAVPPEASGALDGEPDSGPVWGFSPDGSTHCRADCLHFGVRVDGEYVNPLRFLRLRPRLLPW